MGLLLILYWCAAVVGRGGPPSILGVNSRFGKFNSRLGRREFPVSAATGICRQGLDLPDGFCGQTADKWGKSTKFPVSTGKTANLAPSGGTGRGTASRQRRSICVARGRSSRWLPTAGSPGRCAAPRG